VEGVLASVDQQTQPLQELSRKTDEINVDLHKEADTDIQGFTTIHTRDEDDGRSHLVGIQNATGKSKSWRWRQYVIHKNGIHLQDYMASQTRRPHREQ
jgi:hypothetical protein